MLTRECWQEPVRDCNACTREAKLLQDVENAKIRRRQQEARLEELRQEQLILKQKMEEEARQEQTERAMHQERKQGELARTRAKLDAEKQQKLKVEEEAMKKQLEQHEDEIKKLERQYKNAEAQLKKASADQLKKQQDTIMALTKSQYLLRSQKAEELADRLEQCRRCREDFKLKNGLYCQSAGHFFCADCFVEMAKHAGGEVPQCPERCGPWTMKDLFLHAPSVADRVFTRRLERVPAYWSDKELLIPAEPRLESKLETFINELAEPKYHGFGRDSHKVKFSKFKVTSVLRVQNKPAWAAYASRRDVLYEELCAQPLRTTDLLTKDFRHPLESGQDMEAEKMAAVVNEVYLFHGTTRADCIAKAGFDVKFSYVGAAAGAFFGNGIYLAESPSKSDQYAGKDSDGCIIIARALLGRFFIDDDSHGAHFPIDPSVPGGARKFDSKIVARDDLRFREIIIAENNHTYPEFIVNYKRV